MLKNVLVVNPWAGRIGPNTFLSSFVMTSLGRGNNVQIIYPYRDKYSIELENLGCTMLYFSPIKLRHISNPLSKLFNRVIAEYKLFMFLKQLRTEFDYYLINTEILSFSLSAIRRSSKKYCVVHSLSFEASPYISRAVFSLQYLLGVKLISVSNAVKVKLKLCYRKLDVTTIYNGVDVQYFRSRGSDQKSTCEKQVQLLCVIHPVPHKGALHLVRVLAEVARRNTSFHCTVVGWGGPSQDSEYIRNVEDLIHRYQLDSYITLEGSSEDLRSHYASADLLVHPSKSESFGYVLAEAMACELPVVAFKVGGIPEVVNDNCSGYLIEPYDESAMAEAILALMRSATLRKSFGLQGRQRVLERFDAKRNMTSLLDIIESTQK